LNFNDYEWFAFFDISGLLSFGRRTRRVLRNEPIPLSSKKTLEAVLQVVVLNSNSFNAAKFSSPEFLTMRHKTSTIAGNLEKTVLSRD
jgi:hypothetical protein